jgi:hypothetical protein
MAVAFNHGLVGGAAKACVGPLSSRNAVAGQTCQPDIIKNNRTSSGHIRAFPGISGHRRIREDRRVRYRPLPVMPSRMARRCGIARRRIACRMDRRVRYRRSPDTASRIVVACPIVRRRIVCRRDRRSLTCRHIPARVGDLCVSAVFPVGRAARPSSAMFRPNMAREPTPPPAVYEHIFLRMAVAFYRGTFGGAAQRHRWAA